MALTHMEMEHLPVWRRPLYLWKPWCCWTPEQGVYGPAARPPPPGRDQAPARRRFPTFVCAPSPAPEARPTLIVSFVERQPEGVILEGAE